MTKNKRVRLEGTVKVALPLAEAFEMFTPSGERSWAHGWDPRFPAEVVDETEPGTVFLTEHERGSAIWTVVGRRQGSEITYSSVRPGERAGLVSVACEAFDDESTTATVRYDMTALSEQAETPLEHFAEGFSAFLAHWQEAIDQAVRTRSSTGENS